MASIGFINKGSGGGGETPSTSNIKLFETEEKMQADPAAKEGDIALIYSSKEEPLAVGETYTTLILPKTITFDSAITSTKNIFLGNGTITNTPFIKVTDYSITFYKPKSITGTVVDTVSYTSSDGITYTRADDLAEILTVAEIYENAYSEIIVQENNYDILKQMFKSIIRYFGGIYKYTLATEDGVGKYIIAPTQLNTTAEDVYSNIFYGANGIETGILTQNVSNSFADVNAEIYSKIQKQYENMEPRILTDDDKTIDKNIYFIPVKKDGTVLLDTSNVTNMYMMFQKCTNLTTIPELNTSNVTTMGSMFNNCKNLTEIRLLDTSNVTNMSYMFQNCTNLTTIPSLDTGKVATMSGMFQNCTNLTTIPELNTSNVTNMSSMFQKCTNLTTIPLLDTSNVSNMNNMFQKCTNLTTIPSLNTSKVDYMTYMFQNCTKLTNESLNNILMMCKNATSYTGTKTLKYIGLTSEQATKCTTLSNYSAFTSAGWTTGF